MGESASGRIRHVLLLRCPARYGCVPTSLKIPLCVAELRKHPVDGFSAGLVDDDNLLEWDIMIMGYGSDSVLRERLTS